MINIDQLIKNATLSKDKVALNAYKNLKAEEQKVLTSKNAPKELTSEAQLLIFNRYAKSLEDAISQFSKANRDDLVAEYTSELEVIKKLLPEPVNESDIKIIFAQWFEEQEFGYKLGADKVLNLPKKDMGNAIKHLKSKFPTADGKMISEIVKKYII